jgi:DNA-binding MarR family transcriptional regulator
MSATVDQDRCVYVVGAGAARRDGSGVGAWIAFQHAHRVLTRRLEGELERRHGLSLSALELLGHLATAERRRRRLARLADDIGLSVSRVSRIVDALERRGLVERQPCSEDSRATYAWLTDAGDELVRAAQAAHLADIRHSFLARLSDDELRVLDQVFARLTSG